VDTLHLQLTGRPQHAASFVGRTAELDCLVRCFNAALQGERQFVFLSGPPGIGKTALVDNFLEQVVGTRPRLLSPTPSTQHLVRGLGTDSVLSTMGQARPTYLCWRR
jgi:Cdc6-like AAA superfamily ATPase